MSSTKSRFVLAAALTALSLPSFASEPAQSATSGDPTWPAIENPAPPLVVNGRGDVEALRADPLYPATDNASPTVALVALPDDGLPLFQPAETWDVPSVAVARPSASKAAEHVAAAAR